MAENGFRSLRDGGPCLVGMQFLGHWSNTNYNQIYFIIDKPNYHVAVTQVKRWYVIVYKYALNGTEFIDYMNKILVILVITKMKYLMSHQK